MSQTATGAGVDRRPAKPWHQEASRSGLHAFGLMKRDIGFAVTVLQFSPGDFDFKRVNHGAFLKNAFAGSRAELRIGFRRSWRIHSPIYSIFFGGVQLCTKFSIHGHSQSLRPPSSRYEL